ncbi:SHOCT domain-containing protein [Maribacter polysiphoniae]|uniref:Membrane protein n=2 Tax=Flavobacteriaceae TaxID=49546 RepID=A0A444VLR4_9FLAO|nr:SHOCT domain-containing protein [Maribacter polysiphoniae]MBD1260696.1 SHOCT domain-containing protein [Maribacter polysiphoniae]PWK24173.1 putative membrane protein [Maribacter polysiphoniae]RPG36727.1 MAG: SHOCT domain-containing protein [Muricauda sp. TMED12]RYC51649.1 membrane protein [Allomuricauda olearia]|tara:strand:+ start:26708 stop:26899 length:192 start_codon:yes stop_codon:yes gene_type:complete
MMMYWWVIVLVVLVLGISMYAGKNGNVLRRKQKPMDILDERFAKGEVSKEEYEEQKRIINSKN